MMSQIPIRLEGMKKEDIDREILRAELLPNWMPSTCMNRW